jgi:hypothetical protein
MPWPMDLALAARAMATFGDTGFHQDRYAQLMGIPTDGNRLGIGSGWSTARREAASGNPDIIFGQQTVADHDASRHGNQCPCDQVLQYAFGQRLEKACADRDKEYRDTDLQNTLFEPHLTSPKAHPNSRRGRLWPYLRATELHLFH